MVGRGSSLVLLVVLVIGACSRTERSRARDAAAAPADPRIAAGGALWTKYCALCHGDQAQGYAADHAPSLVSPTFLATAGDPFLRGSIELGRPGTSMAAYGQAQGGPLGADDVVAIIQWLRSQRQVDRSVAAAPGPGDAKRGAAIFQTQCKPCHGERMERGDAVWLAHPNFLALADDAFLRRAIVDGRPGTPMQAFGAVLTAPQIDDVVAVLRSWAPEGGVARPAKPAKAPPLDGPIVINPDGPAPELHLRADRFVPAADVARALAEKRKMIIVDARPPSDWDAMRIPGAVSVPYYAMTEVARLPRDDTWILTYCACPHHSSGVILDELRKRGYQHTAIIDEGILFWRQRGYPVDGQAPPPIPTQVPVVDRITGFTLIDAATDQPVAGFDPIRDGATLDRARLPPELSVRVDGPAGVGSVVFGYDDKATYRAENTAPYSITGDAAGDYAAWTPDPIAGAHVVTATTFAGPRGSGQPGATATLRFTVVGADADP